MIELVVVELYVMEAAGQCSNPGMCCYSCPLFDVCEHHDEDPED